MDQKYWKQIIEIEENGIFLIFGITNKKQIKLQHFSSKPMEKSALMEKYRNESNQSMMDEGDRMKDMEISML